MEDHRSEFYRRKIIRCYRVEKTIRWLLGVMTFVILAVAMGSGSCSGPQAEAETDESWVENGPPGLPNDGMVDTGRAKLYWVWYDPNARKLAIKYRHQGYGRYAHWRCEYEAMQGYRNTTGDEEPVDGMYMWEHGYPVLCILTGNERYLRSYVPLRTHPKELDRLRSSLKLLEEKLKDMDERLRMKCGSRVDESTYNSIQ